MAFVCPACPLQMNYSQAVNLYKPKVMEITHQVSQPVVAAG